MFLLLLLACVDATPKHTGDTGSDSGDTASDTGDTGSDSGDTGDTGDTGSDTGSDTGDTGDTGSDTGDTGCGTYADADGDGFGDPAAPSCDPEAVADATDCDDADPLRFPGAPELCDGGPNDCDAWTEADEAGRVTAWPTPDAPVDRTAEWAAGLADAPAALALTEPAYTVCSGTWFVQLVIADPVSVSGPHGAAATVLDGAGGRVVHASAALGLSGLTITGGDAQGEDGGGLLHLAGELALRDVAIVGNVGSLGGGLSVQHDPHDPATVTLTDVELRDNVGDIGGGGFFEVYAEVAGEGLHVEGNRAALVGGGLAVEEAAALRLRASFLGENEAEEAGGGLFADTSWPMYLEDVRVYANRAGGEGGGAWVANPDNVDLTSIELEANEAGSAGGGLAAFVDSLRTTAVTAVDNVAAGDGGGVYALANGVTLAGFSGVANVAGGAGGAAALQVSSLASFTDAFLWENEAVAGGGAWVSGAASARGRAAASVVAELSTVDVWANRADDGGGLWLEAGSIPLDAVSVRANEATGDGGGLWASGAVSAASGTTFEDQRATRGAGVYQHAGGLTCVGSTRTDEGFRRNAAEVGGAVALSEDATLEARACDFGEGADDNTATDQGADVYLSGPEESWEAGDDATFACDGATCG